MKTYNNGAFGGAGLPAMPMQGARMPPGQMPSGQMHGFATVPATSDAKEYLRLLLRHKLGLVIAALLGVGIAWLYLISTDRVYETSALVEVKEDGGSLLDRVDSNQTDWNAPTIKEEANRLASRKVLQPVIDRYDLRTQVTPNEVPVLAALARRIPPLEEWVSGLEMARPYAWGKTRLEIGELDVPRGLEDKTLTLVSLGDGTYRLLRKENVLVDSAAVGERLQIDLGDDESIRIQVAKLDAPAGVEFSVRRRSLQSTVGSLRGSLATETSDSKSRMITVKLQGEDPDLITELTNAIVAEYQAVLLDTRNVGSDKQLAFYEKEVPKVEAELRAAELALSRFRSRSDTYDQDTQTKAKLGQLDKLETEMTELQIERDELAERYTDIHPSTRLLDKQIDVLQRKMNQISGGLRARPNTERELSVLDQTAETKREVYSELNQQLQTLRIAQAGNVGTVEIYDPALSPRRPISPNSSLVLLACTLATVFLYLLWLTLRSALSTTITDQESLERASGLPVYMNIPKSAAQRKVSRTKPLDAGRLLAGDKDRDVAGASVLALSKPEDYSIENIRGLRGMLEDVMAGADNNVLMVTSPLPSMGKSFISLNLAVLLAQSGRRVLLIDADYQRGQLNKSLGLPMGPGLPEVVRGKSELRETVKATSIQNLYCIPRGFGSSGDSGGGAPSDKEFAAFMQVVAPRFDIAIIDTPPVLSVATAATLGRHAGSTIMVVKEGEVKESQLNESIKRLMFSGVRISGCILNGSSTPTPKHYAYYRERLD